LNSVSSLLLPPLTFFVKQLNQKQKKPYIMKNLLFSLLAACTLASCSKNNDNVNPPNNDDPASSTVRIKTNAGGSGVTDYTYEDKGRIITSKYNGGSNYEYSYQPGIVSIKRLTSGGALIQTDTYELNGDGYCAKIIPGSNPTQEELFFYNADKTLAKQTYMSGGIPHSFDYFFSNGNLDSVRHVKNGTPTRMMARVG
jgi:hypothetical protein